MGIFGSRGIAETKVADQKFIQAQYWRLTRQILSGLSQLKFLNEASPSFVPLGKTRDESLLEIASLMRWHVLILETDNFEGWTREAVRSLISRSIKIVESFTISDYHNILALYKHLNSLHNPGMRFVSEEFLKKYELDPHDWALNSVLESMDEVLFVAKFHEKYHQLGESIYADHVQQALEKKLEARRSQSQ